MAIVPAILACSDEGAAPKGGPYFHDATNEAQIQHVQVISRSPRH